MKMSQSQLKSPLPSGGQGICTEAMKAQGELAAESTCKSFSFAHMTHPSLSKHYFTFATPTLSTSPRRSYVVMATKRSADAGMVPPSPKVCKSTAFAESSMRLMVAQQPKLEHQGVAGRRIVEITELLEMVLLHVDVDMKTLLLLQCVSKTWRAVRIPYLSCTL